MEAALTVPSLSDIFTQNIENADLAAEVGKTLSAGAGYSSSARAVPLHAERMATENEGKAIFAICRKDGMTDDVVRSVLNDKYKV